MLYEHRKHDGSLPIIGVNTFRRPGRRRRHARPRRAGPRDRGGEGVPAAQGPRVPGRARLRGRGRAGPAQGGRGVRRQRVRGPHGRGPGLHPRPGHRGVLRGGRAVPAECLSLGAGRALVTRCPALPLLTPCDRTAVTATPADDLGTPYDGPRPAAAWSAWSRRSPRRWHRYAATRSSARPTGARTRPTSTTRSRPGARHQEPRPGRDPRRCGPTWWSPTRRRTASSTSAGSASPGIRVWVTDIETVPQAVDQPRAAVRRALGWDRPGVAGAGAGRAGAATSRPSPARSPSPSGATRGWSSAGTRSPATWCAGSAGTTSSPGRGDRYPKVDARRSSTAPAPTSCCSPTSPTCSPPTTVPRRSPRTPTALVSGRLLTWYGPSLLEPVGQGSADLEPACR